MTKHIHIHLPVRKTKDAGWSAKHVGNFRFEVTTPEGKKISVGRAENSAEAIAKAKKLPDGASHDAFPTKFSIHGRNYISAGKLRNNGQQACYEELDASGKRTGRMVWMTTGGQVVADQVKDVGFANLPQMERKASSGSEAEEKRGESTLVVTYAGNRSVPYGYRLDGKALSRSEAAAWLAKASSKDTRDSEENDAYIKGYRDALAGKPKDQEFHPGGSKKPSVTLKYAEGHKQGTEDRKRKGSKDAKFVVTVVGRDYKETKKEFKNGPLDSPDKAERDARAYAKKMEASPDVRSVRVSSQDEGPGTSTMGIRG